MTAICCHSHRQCAVYRSSTRCTRTRARTPHQEVQIPQGQWVCPATALAKVSRFFPHSMFRLSLHLSICFTLFGNNWWRYSVEKETNYLLMQIIWAGRTLELFSHLALFSSDISAIMQVIKHIQNVRVKKMWKIKIWFNSIIWSKNIFYRGNMPQDPLQILYWVHAKSVLVSPCSLSLRRI